MGDDFLFCLQNHAEHFPQLVVIGLDEERLVRQHLHEQLLGGIHNDIDAPALQPAHDALVNIIRQGIWYAACQHQGIPCLQLVQLGKELCLCLLGDIRSLAVDFRLRLSLDLYIDAGKALRQLHKIALAAELIQLAHDFPAGKACQKAQGCALMAQILQHDGHVDALAAPQHLLILDTIDFTGSKTVQTDNIIKSRIKGNCVNHFSSPTSIIFVSFLYLLSGSTSVMMSASGRRAKVTGKIRLNFELSASTKLFRQRCIASVLTLLSLKSGVENPAVLLMPLAPKNPLVKL